MINRGTLVLLNTLSSKVVTSSSTVRSYQVGINYTCFKYRSTTTSTKSYSCHLTFKGGNLTTKSIVIASQG